MYCIKPVSLDLICFMIYITILASIKHELAIKFPQRTKKAILQLLLRHSFGHPLHRPLHRYSPPYAVLGNSISWAQSVNDLYSVFAKDYPSKFLVHINIPFATEVALLATIQLLSSLAILSFNRKPAFATYMHYASALGLLSSFAVSATICATANYYNKQIADMTKVQYIFTGP